MTGGGALAGVKVVDVGSALAGPWASSWLADHGADVIMVEPVHGMDAIRHTGPVVGETTGTYIQMHRSKRAIRVNLRDEKGRALIEQLVADADVFSQNMRPGVIERLGLGYDDLTAVNPDLVYLSVSGFGPTGPYANQPVYDPIIQAVSGMAASQGGDFFKSAAADKLTAMTAANAVLTALVGRGRGTGGQHVEVNMLDAIVSWLWMDCMWNEVTPDLPDIPNYTDWYAPYDAKDGQIAAVWLTESQYDGAMTALDADHLREDERFNTRAGRLANGVEMREVISAEIAKWTRDELIDRMRANDVPCGPVLDRSDVRHDPQVQHNGTIIDQEHPEAGNVRIAKTPANMGSTPPPDPTPAPGYGEHTDEVLTSLGLSPEEIANLRADGVVA